MITGSEAGNDERRKETSLTRYTQDFTLTCHTGSHSLLAVTYPVSTRPVATATHIIIRIPLILDYRVKLGNDEREKKHP